MRHIIDYDPNVSPDFYDTPAADLWRYDDLHGPSLQATFYSVEAVRTFVEKFPQADFGLFRRGVRNPAELLPRPTTPSDYGWQKGDLFLYHRFTFDGKLIRPVNLSHQGPG